MPSALLANCDEYSAHSVVGSVSFNAKLSRCGMGSLRTGSEVIAMIRHLNESCLISVHDQSTSPVRNVSGFGDCFE